MERPTPEVDAVVWLGWDGTNRIYAEHVPMVPVKRRSERKKCRHTHVATISGPTKGGWPGICLLCGARWR